MGYAPIIEKANEHNTAGLANVSILSSAIAPDIAPCLFRIVVAFSVAGVFKATITKAGNTQTIEFNSGVNLVANSVYMFDLLVHSGDTVNFQYSVNATLLVLRVSQVVS